MLVPKVKLLTAAESAALSGVSIDTINQYRDFGLLKVQNVQGQDYFEEEDIKIVFNSRIVGRAVEKSQSLPDQASIKPEDPELPTLSSILGQEAKQSSTKVVKLHADKPPEVVVKIDEVINSGNKDNSGVICGELEDKANSTNNNSYTESEGPSSIEVLELSRSLKQQLELVMSERDWLRQRVEKLEVQLERQQLISMTETETLRIMAKSKEERPSPWSFLLSWTQPKNK
jgi:DNA-binding transcriptional MerR regulator